MQLVHQLFLQLPSSRLRKSTYLLSRFGLSNRNLRISSSSILEKDIFFYYAATTVHNFNGEVLCGYGMLPAMQPRLPRYIR